jgi:hypothetical protein
MNPPRGAQLAPVPSLFARTRGTRWLPLVGVGGLCAIAALVACGGGNDQPPPVANNPPPVTTPLVTSMNVMSGPAQYVSGGDTRIEIQAPTAEHANLELRLNGAVVAPKLVAGENRLEGVVAGLKDGDNVLELHHKTRGKLSSLKLTNYPITGPIYSGPHQQPFVCMTTQGAVGKQPLVEPGVSSGFPVFDSALSKIGYSQNCAIETFVTYWYRTTGKAWKVLPSDGSTPADMAKTTMDDGRQVDFIVRQERGTINRFLYSFAMLAPRGEDPAAPNLSLWNGRLQYWFQGGVAIGHSQGNLHAGSMNADILGKGHAIVHSSGNNTSTHYNMQLAAETAMMTKERFVERYGKPLYTYGLGGSGGAIQQYMLAQNQPGILDAALPVQSYPDMATQTIHVGDCELLEHYMDVTDRTNAKWQVTKNRTWLVGMNAEDGVADPLAAAKTSLGYNTATGSSECIKAWRGLTPLAMNPWYGQAPNQALMEPAGIMNSVQWTHYDDLRNIYGVDANNNPRPTWDNVGVQYGLKSMKEGKITPDEFLDLNFKVGGWKHPNQMVQEGFPFLGSLTALNFDPWSKRNMNLSTAVDVPAPRTAGDPIAMRAAYTSGIVFGGQIPLPTIDHRQYMERELDMHNVHQSFAVRKRVIQKMGNSDHLVIWFTDTMPGVTRASQSFEAIAVMDEWMANIKANPTKSVAANRPAKAVDSCFDVTGKLMYSGPDVWDGIINDKPKGACAWAFPMYGTSRTVAGAPIEGGIYKCALKPVDTAVADGTYAPWMPTAAAVTKLKQIFPDGVCDYSRPDQARPS